MHPMLLFSALLLSIGAAQATPPAATTAPTRLDHVLLWGHGIDEATAVMAVKLGFQVRPGRDPGGVANRYIRFADTGYIELLGVTRPNPSFDPGMEEDRRVLKDGPGARTFGLRTSALEAVHSLLAARSYALTPFFSGPDSARPGWRLFAFDKAPLSSNTFFIDYAADYAPDQRDPSNRDDYRVTREHPNGARQLSAIWLVSASAQSDRQALAHMGFGHAVPIKLPEVGARGFCVPVGPTALLVLEPDGKGVAADVMANGGPRVLGASIGVADLGRARRWVERGYEQPLATYPGVWGEAFLAPTRDDLGLSIEFHAVQSAPAACPGAGS